MSTIPGAKTILERSDSVRKISSLKEHGEISEPGTYAVDVHYDGTGPLSSSALRSLRMLFSHKASDDVAQHVEQKICEETPQAHHAFIVEAGKPVRWTLEVKSGSLAKGLPVRVSIQKFGGQVEAEEPVLSPRVGIAPSSSSRLELTSKSEPVAPTVSADSSSEDEDRALPPVSEPEPDVAFENAPPPGEPSSEDSMDGWTELSSHEDEEEEGEADVEEVEGEDDAEPVAPQGTNVVWKEQASLKRGRGAERTTPLLEGFYRLILQKTDNLAGPQRTISCTLKLTRQEDGSLIKQHTREVGGFKNGRKLIIDFAVEKQDAPAVFQLNAETNAKARIVPVKLTALIVYRGENEAIPQEALKSRSMRPLKRLAESRSSATNLAKVEVEDNKKKGPRSKLLLEVKALDILGTKKWDLVLGEGYYYLGVVNVSNTKAGGERKTVTGKLELSRSDDVPITTMESEPLPQDSLPWKAFFHVSGAQAPAKLHISVTSHIKGIGSGVRTSLKVKELPDPYSYEEIKRRSELFRHIAVAVVGVLLALSYSMQFIQFVFSLCIPLVGISIRMICTLVALGYAFTHREELIEFLRVKMAEGQENIKWLMELDDSDTSIQKLKLLRERQNKKREEKRKRLDKLRQL